MVDSFQGRRLVLRRTRLLGSFQNKSRLFQAPASYIWFGRAWLRRLWRKPHILQVHQSEIGLVRWNLIFGSYWISCYGGQNSTLVQRQAHSWPSHTDSDWGLRHEQCQRNCVDWVQRWRSQHLLSRRLSRRLFHQKHSFTAEIQSYSYFWFFLEASDRREEECLRRSVAQPVGSDVFFYGAAGCLRAEKQRTRMEMHVCGRDIADHEITHIRAEFSARSLANFVYLDLGTGIGPETLRKGCRVGWVRTHAREMRLQTDGHHEPVH